MHFFKTMSWINEGLLAQVLPTFLLPPLLGGAERIFVVTDTYTFVDLH